MQTSRNKSRFYVGKYYEVSDVVLGCGSFSTVYLATHKIFGTKVALKVIDRKNIKEDYVLRNLHREAKILRKLNHPNIVNFYEEFSHNELYCLAMEFINGPDLSHYLRNLEYRRVSEKTAKVFFYQMVSAVHHMHRANILHRDLKQENILLEYGKVIKIVDFGLSNTYQPKVQLRTHCGSLVYAAPELFQQHSVYGAGVDLWSLGVILYAMVVGSMPFEVSKDIKSSISQSNKERFLRRISKGLTEENWENMGHLSYGCTNLLENLLQPDQFKRIRIEGVRQHPWFLNDNTFRKRLPQHRMDLKRKFEDEIMDIMADRLHQPESRIRMHLVTRDKYDRVSAMFFILQDTLVKEVLYPPKDLENSLIYHLECRRKSQTSARQEPLDDEQDQECEEEDKSSEFSVAKNSRGFSTSTSTFVSHNFIPEAPSKPKIKKNFSEMGNIASIRKRIGDGGHLEKKISEGNITRTPKTNNPSSNVKSSIPQRIEDQRLMPTHSEAGYRFRSYKNNRPTRVVKDNTFTARKKGQDEFKNHTEGNDYHEIDNNNSSFSNYSIKSNFQSEVESLKERFEKECAITSKNIVQRNHNLGNQRNTASSASHSVNSQTITMKRLTNVDKYTAQQLGQIQKSYIYRPTTNERVIKSSQANPYHNNKSYEKCPVNTTVLSHNQKEISQMKQRSLIIRRSNASNTSHSANKAADERGQYGRQGAYAQKSTFDTSKNVSNYEANRLQKAPSNAISNRGQFGRQGTYTQKPTFDTSKNISNYETKRLQKAPSSAISNTGQFDRQGAYTQGPTFDASKNVSNYETKKLQKVPSITICNRGQYGRQGAYAQKLTFSTSKNNSNYESKKLQKAPSSVISKREDPAKNRTGH